ncbi:MAG: (5-formylfuran-3-yl)methyl phosphate synthase [Gammaproteobacteria bacterium]
MTGMLASVTSLEEADLALAADVDIIDLKQPASGALGALDIQTIQAIVSHCDGRRPVSATIGDLPMHPVTVADAVAAMAETGVDYIKIGFFPGGDWPGTIRELSAQTRRHPPMIAVLFADTRPDLDIIETLQIAGFKGVMLDTMDKKQGALTDVMAPSTIGAFVMQVKSRRMLCGLAGSLRQKNIPELMPYRPDYLGFRGALCEGLERSAHLNIDAVANIKQAIADFKRHG